MLPKRTSSQDHLEFRGAVTRSRKFLVASCLFLVFFVLLLFRSHGRVPEIPCGDCARLSTSIIVDCSSWDQQCEVAKVFAKFGQPFPGKDFGKQRHCPWHPPLNADVMHKTRKAILATLMEDCGMWNGIEMGALHHAAEIPSSCALGRKFVDKFPLEKLYATYPNLKEMKLNAPDILADASLLETIKDSSLDYVLGFHILEHLPNASNALKNWIRVLKQGGLLVFAVPNKCVTFDKNRVVTSMNHFLSEFNNSSPENVHESEHEREWALSHITSLNRANDLIFFEETRKTMKGVFSFGGAHYHTWDKDSFDEFIETTRKLFELDELFRVQNDMEFLAVFRKQKLGQEEICSRKKRMRWNPNLSLYRTHNPDLEKFSDQELLNHYWEYGCLENRRVE